MKKLKFLKIGVLALFFAVIMTSTIVAGTFAKFVSVINGGARSQAAGFKVSATSTQDSQNLNSSMISMLAPEEEQNAYLTLSYFSQVNTEFSVTNSNLVTGTGAFEDFAQLKADFQTYLTENSLTYTPTLPATLSDMFSVKIGSSTNLANEIAGLVRTAGTLGGANQYVAAMDANATTAISVNVPFTIKWESEDGVTDLWDTFVGNKIAEKAMANPSQKSYISVSLNLRIEQLLGEMQGETLANTRWVFNSTPNTSSLEEGRTYNVNFTSNGENFTGIERGSLIYVKANGDKVTAYSDSTGWADKKYKTINITGGSNATLYSLRNWVEANATEKVEVPLVVSAKANLQAYTWAELSLIAKDIAVSLDPEERAEEYNIAVGDTKTYTMTGDNAGTYTARVVGIAHDTVTNAGTYGATKAGLTFETTSLLTTTYVINSSSPNISWENCTFRATTLPTLLSAMDSNLTSIIVAVDKTTANDCTTTPTSASVTSDSLWLMSKTEMTGESNQRKRNSYNHGDPIAEGSQYSYYSVHNTKSDRKKQGSGSDNYYWLRSPYGYVTSSNNCCFNVVSNSGSIDSSYARGDYRVAPCFCL